MSPVLAPARIAGPGSAPPNFAIERRPAPRSTLAGSLGAAPLAGSLISIAATPNAAAVGDLVVVCFCWALATTALSTVTDTSGNTWNTVSTPATASESGGYGWTIVTVPWANGGNTVTGTLASSTGGGRCWAAASIPALYNPVVDQHNESTTTGTVTITTAAPLAQEIEEVLILDIQRSIPSGNTPQWVWGQNFTDIAHVNGSGTAGSGVGIGSYTNLAGATQITGTLAGQGTGDLHGTSIFAVKVTIPGGGGPTNWNVTPNDSVTMSDGLAFDRAISLADNPLLADALAFDYAINPGDSVTMSDLAVAERGLVATVNDSVTMSDSALIFDRGLGLADNPTLADSLSFDRAINISDNPPLADALAFGRAINAADSVTMSDSASPSRGINVSQADSVTMSDLFAFGRAISIADNPLLADALSFGRALNFADAVTMTDSLAFALPLVLSWIKNVLSYCYNGAKQAPSSEAIVEAQSASIKLLVDAAEPVFQAPSFDGMFETEVEGGP